MIVTEPIEPKSLGENVNEVLTIKEIEARYPSEWVLIVDPVSSNEWGMESGRVVFHSPDRDEMYRKAIEVVAPRIAFYYTGKPPEGTTIVL